MADCALRKNQPLSDDHHVMRHVPWSKLRRDGDDNVIGFLPSAFELRENDNDHEGLSVNWVEYYSGNRQEKIVACVEKFRTTLTVKKKSAFGIANVGQLKDVSTRKGKSIRIIFTPDGDQSPHASIMKMPRDDMEFLEALAVDAFTEMVMNTQVP